MRLSRGDATELVRSVGGLLFATGAVVLLARKSGHHEWSTFAQMLVVLIPAVVLYTLALGAFERPGDDRPRPSQTVLMVASILLWPLALLGFLTWLGAHTNHPLYLAAVFAVTSLLAAYAARRARIRYAALLAGLSALIAWLYAWEKILNPSADTGRWLLVAAGALLLILAAILARKKAIGASELATVGGIGAVAAGVLGVIVGGFVSAFGPLMAITEGRGTFTRERHIVPAHPLVRGMPRGAHVYTRVHGSVPPRPLALHHALPMVERHPLAGSPLPAIAHVASHTSGLQHLGWDIYLLLISVALIWSAARWRVRGLGYVGAAGLIAFIISVAAQITRIESGRAPTASIVGWPLVLIVLGVLGLATPALYRRGRQAFVGPS